MTRLPTIEWQVVGACNYDCGYCIQSRRYRRGGIREDAVDRALDFFASLRGTWEIKCSGGEAFAHAAFIDSVVPGLMETTPHTLSVLTNFSASRKDLMRFARLTRGRLRVFSASLHLEHVSVEAFGDKAAWFVDMLDPEVHFVVNQVIFPGREDEAARCRDVLEAHDLHWFPQFYKVNGGVATYGVVPLARLLDGREHPTQVNTAPSYRGHMCWAGVEYFTVDKDGSVWACRTAKREREGLLGNIYGRVELFETPNACPYDICPCTVPANRGMIEGVQP